MWQAIADQQIDVCMLKETFCTPEMANIIDHNEMLGHAKCISIKHSKGRACIVKQSEDMTVIDKHEDDDGRLLLINMNTNEVTYTFVCIYAPNRENERNTFFSKVDKWIFQCGLGKKRCIIGGDFNYVRNEGVDKKKTCICMFKT